MLQTKEKSFALKFGESVRVFRQQKGFSQEKLAELAEIDRRYMSQIELGKQTPTIVIAYRIAKALDMPLSILIKHAER